MGEPYLSDHEGAFFYFVEQGSGDDFGPPEKQFARRLIEDARKVSRPKGLGRRGGCLGFD